MSRARQDLRSRVGLGSWRMSGSQHWEARVELAEARDILFRALDSGVDWFDTAPTYGFGRAEKILGRHLPNDITVVTKYSQPVGAEATRASVRASLARSLRHLGTRRPVVLLLHHALDHPEKTAEVWNWIADLRDEGWVSAAGVCNLSAEAIDRLSDIASMDHFQAKISVLRGVDEDHHAARSAHHLGICVTAYGVLGHGLLASPGNLTRRYEDTDWRSGTGSLYFAPTAFSVAAREAAAAFWSSLPSSADLAVSAVEGCFSLDYIDRCVVGASDRNQLDLLEMIRVREEAQT